MSEKSTTLTVSELTTAIKSQLETCFSSIVVSGEISNFKHHQSGHFYFDLKDRGAKIPAVLFKGSQRGLLRMPKEGDQVMLRGAVSVYPPHGRYQLIAQTLTFDGVGQLLLKLEALKKELAARGWFEKEHKKALPQFPKTIGVVTSGTGAVIRDIIHVLRRRSPGFHLILADVAVQGARSAGEVAAAIELFNRKKCADVLIVGRGGGSIEDLWSFNEEIVAKAIFESEIPIVSAVGHETDFTIADFVADVRAPTPSAAAELVSAEKAQCLEFLSSCRTQLTRALLSQLQVGTQRLDELSETLFRLMSHQLAQKKLALEGKKHQAAALRPHTQIKHLKSQVYAFQKQLTHASQTQVALKKQHLKHVVDQLSALDPTHVLRRGYSILFAQNHDSVIVSARELTDGKVVRARLSDGESTLVVKNEI